ncbi:hypothetical protein ACROYT_G022612 [Oculina patagonica]
MNRSADRIRSYGPKYSNANHVGHVGKQKTDLKVYRIGKENKLWRDHSSFMRKLFCSFHHLRKERRLGTSPKVINIFSKGPVSAQFVNFRFENKLTLTLSTLSTAY